MLLPGLERRLGTVTERVLIEVPSEPCRLNVGVLPESWLSHSETQTVRDEQDSYITTHNEYPEQMALILHRIFHGGL